jgi:hypothetical protein
VKAVVVASLLLGIAGCAAPGQEIDISHVHGIGHDPDSGAIYLATHHGLARGLPEGGSWTWAYVGSERYDYMGFTQDGNVSTTFYSSGHPDDPRAFGGVHLGLRRSTDGGVTWEQRSLRGEVDFHALTALHGAEGWLAGSWQGKTKVSRDGGLTWGDFPSPPGQVLALASADEALLAGTSAGLWATRDLQGFTGWARMAGPSNGVISSVAASSDGQSMLAGTGDGRSGAAYRSSNGGTTWSLVEHPLLSSAPGQVLFIFNGPTNAFAALGDGSVLQSTDGGATWSQIR